MTYTKPKYWRGRVLLRLIERMTDLSYPLLLLLWLSLMLVFSLAYFSLSYLPGHGPVQIEGMSAAARLFNSIYYSIITATSTGYGDITPQGLSKVLAALQSILALFIFAVFVTKLVTHKQEIALRQVHKLTFEDVYYNLREGFYIVRKDFDRLIKDAETHRALTGNDWEDLRTAFKQIKSLLNDIPSFYDGQNRLYNMDLPREQLLQEAVHRTLERIERFLYVLESCEIDILKEEESCKQIHLFTDAVRDVTFHWQHHSTYKSDEMFEKILSVNEKIQERVKK